MELIWGISQGSTLQLPTLGIIIACRDAEMIIMEMPLAGAVGFFLFLIFKLFIAMSAAGGVGWKAVPGKRLHQNPDFCGIFLGPNDAVSIDSWDTSIFGACLVSADSVKMHGCGKSISRGCSVRWLQVATGESRISPELLGISIGILSSVACIRGLLAQCCILFQCLEGPRCYLWLSYSCTLNPRGLIYGEIMQTLKP